MNEELNKKDREEYLHDWYEKNKAARQEYFRNYYLTHTKPLRQKKVKDTKTYYSNHKKEVLAKAKRKYAAKKKFELDLTESNFLYCFLSKCITDNFPLRNGTAERVWKKLRSIVSKDRIEYWDEKLPEVFLNEMTKTTTESDYRNLIECYRNGEVDMRDPAWQTVFSIIQDKYFEELKNDRKMDD